MSPDEEPRQDRVAGTQSFATTHWSVVLAAGQLESPIAAEALEKLCRAYWYPLYAYVRRLGRNEEDARDLTQEFFARFLAKNSFSLADRERGRLRTFLLKSFNNMIRDEWNKNQRVKRGGGCQFIELDGLTAEQRYQEEPTDDTTPARVYERIWASEILAQAMTMLLEEYDKTGRLKVFHALKDRLTDPTQNVRYAELATQLGMSEAAVKMTASRLRQRYAFLVRAAVANTVADPKEVEEEIRALFAAFSS